MYSIAKMKIITIFNSPTSKVVMFVYKYFFLINPSRKFMNIPLACLNDEQEIVQVLLEAGSNFYAKNLHNCMPAHLAVKVCMYNECNNTLVYY